MKDEINVEGQWEFNGEVTAVFDNMLERSIPGYSDMRLLVNHLSKNFLWPNATVLDLGCSRGGAIASLVANSGEDINFIGIEVSEPMRLAAASRFSNNLNVKIINMDLKHEFPKEKTSLVLSILTIQFTPIEYRQQIFQNIFDSLEHGGAVILVEKILGSNNSTNKLLVDEYYKLKGENGYTEEQINSKRIALEGVLVPVTAKWNEDLMTSVGFENIECFWRNLNFAGWVAIKK